MSAIKVMIVAESAVVRKHLAALLTAERPTPVVMCSTLTEKGGQTTMQALAASAVSFITKPKIGLKDFLEGDSKGIVAAVRAARANMEALKRAMPAIPKPGAARAMASSQDAMAQTTDRVIAVGISTGGVQAIEAVPTGLPRTVPGMVVVQHMPLKRSGAQYIVEVFDGPVVFHHRPNADVLFKSVAQCAGRNAIGVVMTGMGDDGACGLREMFNAGARTAAQDESSCVVYGMPEKAVKHGGVQQVVSLEDVSAWLMASARASVSCA